MRATSLGILIGLMVGFGIGATVFEWKPWDTGGGNQFLGQSCRVRQAILDAERAASSKAVLAKVEAEKAAAEAKEPC